MWFSKLQKLVRGSTSFLTDAVLAPALVKNWALSKWSGPTGCLFRLFSLLPSYKHPIFAHIYTSHVHDSEESGPIPSSRNGPC